MKERPVIFSGPMIRAILDGTKTQTRRVMKPQPISSQLWGYGIPNSLPTHFCVHARWPQPYALQLKHFDAGDPWLPCPYGKPGDRLWVRETHAPLYCDHEDGEPPVIYRADGEIENATWTPSIHMRREYSRITLEICSVRVERLQDISEEDAIAEGIVSYSYRTRYGRGKWQDRIGYSLAGSLCEDKPTVQEEFCASTARGSYKLLWNSIYGKKHPWESNCWVWVISFRRISDAHSE